jgi:hypothetical protein
MRKDEYYEWLLVGTDIEGCIHGLSECTQQLAGEIHKHKTSVRSGQDAIQILLIHVSAYKPLLR